MEIIQGGVLGWHWIAGDKTLAFRDEYGLPKIKIKPGVTLRQPGTIEACASGLHAAPTVLDSLRNKPGDTSILCRVQLGGKIDHYYDGSKVAARDRTVLWWVDGSVFAAEVYRSILRRVANVIQNKSLSTFLMRLRNHLRGDNRTSEQFRADEMNKKTQIAVTRHGLAGFVRECLYPYDDLHKGLALVRLPPSIFTAEYAALLEYTATRETPRLPGSLEKNNKGKKKIQVITKC